MYEFISSTGLPNVLPTLLIQAIIVIGATGLTENSTTNGNLNQPPSKPQEIPTFVGSDGVVRQVSPSAILAEMKRCLPSGLPLPVESMFPELPPHLEQKEEKNNPNNDKNQNLNFYEANYPKEQKENSPDNLELLWLKNEMENKRVLRSEESALKNAEVPSKDSVVYAATELDSKKLADILKDLLTKQLQKNASTDTSHYMSSGELTLKADKSQKAYQNDDYSDYDYEEPKTNLRQQNYASVAIRDHPVIRKPKRRRFHVRSGRRQTNYKPKRPERPYTGDYDNVQELDYDEPANDSLDGAIDPKELKSWVRNNGAKIFGGALQRQLELSDSLHSMTDKLLGKTEIGESSQMHQKSVQIPVKTSRSYNEVIEGYKKVLAMVMELNVNLVQTLERVLANSMCQKGMKSMSEVMTIENGMKSKPANPDATSVLLDCVDVLMQQRKQKEIRSKKDHGNVFDLESE